MKTITELDRIDRRILNVLQKDGRIANVELARRVNLTPTPCLERVKRLEKDGFITEYVALIDPVKANAALCAYIEIQLTNSTTEAFKRFNQQMLDLPEVQECQMVAGGFDYLIKIRVYSQWFLQDCWHDRGAMLDENAIWHCQLICRKSNYSCG